MGQDFENESRTVSGALQADELSWLIDALAAVAVRVDDDGTITEIADPAPATLAGEPARLVGSDVGDLIVESTPDGVDVSTAAAFRERVLTGQADDTVVPVDHPNGSVQRLAVTAVSPPETPGAICVASEIADERDAGPAISDDGDELLNALPDPAYVLDADDRVTQINDALVAHTGYERDALVGRHLEEIVPGRAYESLAAQLTDLADADGRGSATAETTLLTSDGQPILMEAHHAVFTDDAGAYDGTIGVLRDIRDRKQRERDLDLLKQILARVFRHNVRNELEIVRARADAAHGAGDDVVKHHTDKLQSAAERLLDHSEKARLIEDVVETDHMTELDLGAAVRDIVDDVRDQHPDAAVTADVPEGVTVDAHPDFTRAIEELVENALKHAPDERTTTVDIWLDREEDADTLFVEDDAGGLADHEIAVLRRGHESDLEHGSGVGLWLVRWLVEYSEAEMIAHRTDDGSLMGVRFPRSSAERRRDRTLDDSPLARAPTHVRDRQPERFRGDAVIGRVDALEQLETIFDALDRRGGYTALVTGEAGIGKTTLVEQFRRRVADRDEDPVVATGFSEPDVQPPYYPFTQVFEDLPSETNIAELLAEVASLSVSDADELERRKRSLFADIADQLRAVAADRPVVLIVEDLQWADRGTIDLFEYLVDEVGRWAHPVMFVGTSRTGDVDHTHPVVTVVEETASAGRGTVVELSPFDTDEIEALLSYVLDVDSVPSSLVESVHDHTGGTPLFVSELARNLQDSAGPIRTSADLPETLTGLDVPETIERAIDHRLDGLPADVRPVLEAGAVIRTGFTLDLLRAVTDESTDVIVDSVETLRRRNIWEQFDGSIEFVHGVVREQALAAIDDDRRRRLHAAVAEAIETVYPDRTQEFAGRLAHHYENAGDTDAAIEHYRQAGDYATDRYAMEAAIEHYEGALSLLDPTDRDAARSGEVLEKLATAHTRLGEYDAAIDAARTGREHAPAQSPMQCRLLRVEAKGRIKRGEYDLAQSLATGARLLARRLDHQRYEATALHQLGNVARAQGAYERAKDNYERALTLLDESDEKRQRARTESELGTILFEQGEYDQAKARYERTLTIANDLSDASLLSKAHNELGLVAFVRGDMDAAHDHHERSLEASRETGNPTDRSTSLNNLGLIAEERDEFEAARDYYQQSLQIDRRIGDRKGQCFCLHNLGRLAVVQGEYDRAREQLAEGREIAVEIDDPQSKSMNTSDLGRVALQRGAFDTAEQRLTQSLEIDRDIGDRRSETINHIRIGQLALRRDELGRAEKHLQRGLELGRELDMPRERLESLRWLVDLRRRQRDFDAAAARLEDAQALLDEVDSAFAAATITLAAGRLALARDDCETATERAAQAWDVFSELGTAHEQARATRLQGAVAADGDLDRAREYWQDALDTFDEIGAHDDALRTLRDLVDHAPDRDSDDADEWRTRARNRLEDAPASTADRHRTWIDDSDPHDE